VEPVLELASLHLRILRLALLQTRGVTQPNTLFNEAAALKMFGHTAYIGSAAPDGTLAGIDT
jgi:hypothetical protein